MTPTNSGSGLLQEMAALLRELKQQTEATARQVEILDRLIHATLDRDAAEDRGRQSGAAPRGMPLSEKVLFSKKQAAAALSICVSTLDVAIAQAMLKTRRQGRRVLIHKSELERFGRAEHPRIWPADGHRPILGHRPRVSRPEPAQEAQQ